MALAALNAINEIAYLAGIFDWNVGDGSYTNPDGATVSFHVVDNNGAPIEQFISGELNTFSLVNNAFGDFFGGGDPNTSLFNTQLTANSLSEMIQRKYTINRVPFANYDQLVDLGVGGQVMSFTVIFSGTMYQTAMLNLIQNLFNNAVPGLGTLKHPFYTTVRKVLPLNFKIDYSYQKLNFVLVTIDFATSDISHLNPSILKNSLASEISEWYIGIQNAILSMGGTVAALGGTASNIAGQL